MKVKTKKEELIVDVFLDEDEDGFVTLRATKRGDDDDWVLAAITSQGLELYSDVPEELGFKLGPNNVVNVYHD